MVKKLQETCRNTVIPTSFTIDRLFRPVAPQQSRSPLLRGIRAYLIQCLFPKVDFLNDFGTTRVGISLVDFWTNGVSGQCGARLNP